MNILYLFLIVEAFYIITFAFLTWLALKVTFRSYNSMHKRSVILLLAIVFILSVALGLLFNKYVLPLFGIYIDSYNRITSALKPILQTLGVVIHWATPIIAYLYLSKSYMLHSESAEGKKEALNAAVENAINATEQDESNAQWYEAERDLPLGDIIIKATAKPAVVRVRNEYRAYHFTLKRKKEYFVVRPGLKVQFINCVPLRTNNTTILPEPTITTGNADSPSADAVPDGTDASTPTQPSTDTSSAALTEQEVIARYKQRKKNEIISLIKKYLPCIITVAVCAALVSGTIGFYSAKTKRIENQYEEYKKNLRAELREDVWHEAFMAGRNSH